MNGNPRTDGAPPQTAPDAPEASSRVQQDPEDPERERLEAELSTARNRVDQLARAYQELERDREEFKQRLTRERDRTLDLERAQVATTLLEAVDELDLCLSMGGAEGSSLAKGVKLIRDGLLAKLQQKGIERIQVMGLPYDPNTAEATDMELTVHPEEDQKVVSEVRAGYRLKERILRPARVKVARYVAPARA